eukprot:CAMPEP_0198275272 /NCGR_PEP_ID=MMETSP1447-20131203/63887_1 /TAXON_ID=420782 /ORGANISM="Chaetoceros dichaeta, Strain CCMP1751" /LENGTH=41 /DNA_ID= /DNA_START= /DNA_END= /DNA_ORIENTATION=
MTHPGLFLLLFSRSFPGGIVSSDNDSLVLVTDVVGGTSSCA